MAFNFQLNMPDALRPLADKVRLSGRGGRQLERGRGSPWAMFVAQDAARQVMSSSFATVVVFYIVMVRGPAAAHLFQALKLRSLSTSVADRACLPARSLATAFLSR